MARILWKEKRSSSCSRIIAKYNEFHHASGGFLFIEDYNKYAKGSVYMLKASKILFLVGGVLAILGIICYILFAAGTFVCGGLAIAIAEGGNPGQEIMDMFNKLIAETKMTIQEIGAAFITMGVVFVVVSVFGIASIVLSFIDKARPNPGLGLLIPSTVIHLLAGNFVSLVGGVLAIVYWATKGRKEI